MKYSAKYADYSGIYMYLVMNLENMARAAEKIENHTYSLMTFDWIYAITGLKHWIKSYVNYSPRPFAGGYNTFPFLMEYYYDFGLPGILVFPLIVGFIIGIIYYNMRIKGTLESVVYYSFGFFFIMISFFTNPLTMLNIVASLLVIWVIQKFILYKNKPAETIYPAENRRP
jgi:oligosaccharide repeat unit polymerase